MKAKKHKAALTDTTEVGVRFSEVDSMKVVWHGGYVRYFEDGRESFGRRWPGLGYSDIAESGFTAPIVSLRVDFKQPLRYGDTAVVETNYIETEAAKICFEYEIRRESDGVVMATGSTVQVFVNGEGELELVNPSFYANWKKRWLEK